MTRRMSRRKGERDSRERWKDGVVRDVLFHCEIHEWHTVRIACSRGFETAKGKKRKRVRGNDCMKKNGERDTRRFDGDRRRMKVVLWPMPKARHRDVYRCALRKFNFPSEEERTRIINVHADYNSFVLLKQAIFYYNF